MSVLHEALGHLAAIPVARLLALLRLRSFGLKPNMASHMSSRPKVEHCHALEIRSKESTSFSFELPSFFPLAFVSLARAFQVQVVFELGSATFNIASATLAASSSCNAQKANCCRYVGRFIPCEICTQDCALMIISPSST